MSKRRKAQEIVTGYSGPLSNYREWHAFGTGFYYGANTEYSKIPDDLWNPDASRYSRDVEREPATARYGFLLGDLYRRHRRKVLGAATAVIAAAGALIGGLI